MAIEHGTIGSDDAELDPQLVDFLQRVQESAMPALETMSPPAAREAYVEGVRLVSAEAPRIARTTTASIDTPGGPLAATLYYPEQRSQNSPPLVLYFHGGGWSFGSIESHDNACRTLCANATCIVASVDYRLAPEHKFPKAVHDAIWTSLWAQDNAAALGADPGKIVLAGDSAGATLATVAAVASRDNDQPDIFRQLLIYPATDMTMSHPSHDLFGEGFRLTRSLMVWSSVNYLRDGRDIMDPRASPLFLDDLSSLPPAIVVTA
ncbi:MAG: alpha/beta hydrolase, partial [Woeseiaceae bacterium]